MGLVGRELRNARGVALGLASFVTLAELLTLASHRVRGGDLSAFDALAEVGVPGLWVLAPAVTRALIAHEHTAKTRAFLEAIPVSRERVIAVKLVVGTALVVTVALAQVLLCMLLGAPHPDGALSAHVAARVTLAAIYATGVSFAVASLGRYFVVASILALFADGVRAALGLGGSLGAWALVGKTFAVDRGALPVVPVIASVAWALAGAAFAAWLWCARAGSLSATLFERMSHREGMRWAAGIVLVMILDHSERARAHGFTLPGVRVARGDVTLYAAGIDDATARRAREALQVVRGWTGGRLPAVAIVRRGDVPRGMVAVERASDEASVVAVHDADDERVAVAAVEAVALHRTETHLRREDTAWALDGLGLLATRWPHVAAPLDDDLDLVLPALARERDAPTADDLRAWRSYRERVGDDTARAVAYSLLRTVARLRGSARVGAMAGTLLHRAWSVGSAASWVLPSSRAAWQEADVTPAEVLAAWNTDVARLRARHADALAQMPRLAMTSHTVATTSRSRALWLSLAADARVAPDAQITVTLWRLGGDDPHEEKGLCPGDDDLDGLLWHGALPAAALAGDGVAMPVSLLRGDRVAWRARVDGAPCTPHRREVLR